MKNQKREVHCQITERQPDGRTRQAPMRIRATEQVVPIRDPPLPKPVTAGGPPDHVKSRKLKKQAGKVHIWRNRRCLAVIRIVTGAGAVLERQLMALRRGTVPPHMCDRGKLGLEREHPDHTLRTLLGIAPRGSTTHM